MLCSSCLNKQWPGLAVQSGGELQNQLGAGHTYRDIYRYHKDIKWKTEVFSA